MVIGVVGPQVLSWGYASPFTAHPGVAFCQTLGATASQCSEFHPELRPVSSHGQGIIWSQ